MSTDMISKNLNERKRAKHHYLGTLIIQFLVISHKIARFIVVSIFKQFTPCHAYLPLTNIINIYSAPGRCFYIVLVFML